MDEEQINPSLLSNTEHNSCCKCKKKSLIVSLFDKYFNNCKDLEKVKDSCSDKEPNLIEDKISSDCDTESKKEKKIVTEYECCIREQNPLNPCCCVKKTNDDENDDDTPCPPNFYQERKEPTCECELCYKNGYHCRCCNRGTYIKGCAETLPEFETA